MERAEKRVVAAVNKTVENSPQLGEIAKNISLQVETVGDMAIFSFKLDERTYSIAFEDITEKIESIMTARKPLAEEE